MVFDVNSTVYGGDCASQRFFVISCVMAKGKKSKGKKSKGKKTSRSARIGVFRCPEPKCPMQAPYFKGVAEHVRHLHTEYKRCGTKNCRRFYLKKFPESHSKHPAIGTDEPKSAEAEEPESADSEEPESAESEEPESAESEEPDSAESEESQAAESEESQ